jgi:hypothetical protein
MSTIDAWTFRRIQLESAALASIPFAVVSASLRIERPAERVTAMTRPTAGASIISDDQRDRVRAGDGVVVRCARPEALAAIVPQPFHDTTCPSGSLQAWPSTASTVSDLILLRPSGYEPREITRPSGPQRSICR